MGNQHSTEEIRARLAGRPIVVVIGGGFAGCALAAALDKDFNVLLLERKSYRFHNIAALRAAVNPDWVSTVAIPYTHLLQNGHVIQCEVEGVQKNGVKIVGRDELIPYNYLVYATGTSYAFPAKVPHVEVEDAKTSFRNVNEAVRKAQNIVIVGGGPVGFELLGEIADHYNNTKNVTLIHSHDWVVQQDLTDKFQREVKRRVARFPNVKVILGEKAVLGEDAEKTCKGATGRYIEGERIVKTDKGTEVKADLIFWCGGSKVNSTAFDTSLPDSVEASTNRLKVNSHFQVQNLPAELANANNIFAVGDCANVKESKLGYFAGLQAEHCATVIRAMDAGKTHLPEYRVNGSVMALTLGQHEGVLQFGPVFGRTVTQMLKGDLTYNKTWKSMNFEPPTIGTNVILPKQQITENDVAHLQKMNPGSFRVSKEEAEKMLAGYSVPLHVGDDHT